MMLFEFYEAPSGFQDLSDDNSRPKWGEGRHTKLTFGEINKLRRMSEIKNFERANNLKKIRAQYKPAPAA